MLKGGVLMKSHWNLFNEVKEALSQIVDVVLGDFLHPDKTGIIHFYQEEPPQVSPTNTAAVISFQKRFPELFKKSLPVDEWKKNLIIPKIEEHAMLINIDKPEIGQFHVYNVAQLLMALEKSEVNEAVDKLGKWLESYIRNWLLNPQRYPFRLFLVYLSIRAIPQLRVSLCDLIETVSLFHLQQQVAVGKCMIWEDFEAIDLAFALHLARPTRPFTQLLPHAAELLISSTSNRGIWRNQELLMRPEDKIARCIAFHGCVALMEPSYDVALLTKIFPAIEAHFNWVKAHKYHNSSWHFSDYHVRDVLIEPWFNLLVAEFLALFQKHLHFALQSSIHQKYASRRISSNLKWQDMMLDVCDKAAIEDKIIRPLTSEAPRVKSNASTIILFGPPGTAKTTIVEILSKKINWPLIEIGVANFLVKGLDQIFSSASEIFRDLLKLQGAVVLLDEVEQIFAERGDDQRDLRQQFLTSALLPPLKGIHDQSDIVLVIATNHIEIFDSAIRRQGRIDLIIPVGPPSLENKQMFLEEKVGLGNNLSVSLATLLPPQTTIGELLVLRRLRDNIACENNVIPLELFKLWQKSCPIPQISKKIYRDFNKNKNKYRRL